MRKSIGCFLVSRPFLTVGVVHPDLSVRFKECVARVAVDKYKAVKAMSEADAIKGFCANLLREANEEEVMVRATLIRADRYDWRRYSKPLPGEPLADFKKWLAIWQRLELMDIYYFPLWEKGVHDLLQKHQKELMQCFLGYTRSISEDSAEDGDACLLLPFHSPFCCHPRPPSSSLPLRAQRSRCRWVSSRISLTIAASRRKRSTSR